jgi:hypothetical protein
MKNKQKKSLGFLSIVAFLMVLVGIGYTVSSVFAVSNAREILASGASNTLLSSGEAYESTMPKESFFSSVERQVAEKATSLWNEMLGTATGTSSDNPNVEDLQNTFSDEYPSTATVI